MSPHFLRLSPYFRWIRRPELGFNPDETLIYAGDLSPSDEPILTAEIIEVMRLANLKAAA